MKLQDRIATTQIELNAALREVDKAQLKVETIRSYLNGLMDAKSTIEDEQKPQKQ